MMQVVAETPTFTRQAEKLLAADDKSAVIDFLAANPFAGDIIPGTGGVRKVRIPLAGRGKSGGARVVYYVFDDDAPIYALLVYAKARRENLSPEDAKAVAAFAAAIKAQYRNRRRSS